MDSSLIHLLGLCGALLGTGSYLLRAPRAILLIHALSWVAWGAYYAQLGGMSGAIVAVLSGVACLTGAFFGEARMKVASGVLLGLIWVTCIASAQQPILTVTTLGPVLATTIEILQMRLRDRPVAFRVTSILSNLCWLGFGLAISAWVSAAFGVINIVVISTGIWLLCRESRGQNIAPA